MGRDLPPGRVLALFDATTAALLELLAALRRAGVAHCDIKPENIAVCGPGPGPGPPFDVRVIDFGKAADLGRCGGGTPAFSPERLTEADAEDDVGAVFLHRYGYDPTRLLPPREVLAHADADVFAAGLVLALLVGKYMDAPEVVHDAQLYEGFAWRFALGATLTALDAGTADALLLSAPPLKELLRRACRARVNRDRPACQR